MHGDNGANVGTAFALREGARALAKVVFPGAGSVVSSGVAFAGTWALGEAAIAYFVHGSTLREARRLLRRRRKAIAARPEDTGLPRQKGADDEGR